LINTSKRREKFLISGFATLILLGLLTVGAFAASNSGEQKHDMGAMTQGSQSGHDMSSMTNDSQSGHDMSSMTNDSQSGHDMSSMTNDSQSGHDMNNMGHSGHDKKETAKDDNPWPILYGFGGFIFAVIISAGIMKFTGRKGRGVN
jgi:hypothetical protein